MSCLLGFDGGRGVRVRLRLWIVRGLVCGEVGGVEGIGVRVPLPPLERMSMRWGVAENEEHMCVGG